MSFLSRFFYDDNANDSGGASNADAEKSNPPATEPEKPLLTAAELQELGFKDIDSLKSHLRTQKENNIPDEEKAKKANIEKVNLLKFATENGIMNVEDYNKMEFLRSKADRDLVFEKFSSEHKEDFPDASDDDIKESFENEYRLNSENEMAKARGESKLSKEAKELRDPLVTKYTTAEKQYAEHRALEGKLPDFNKFIDALIEKNTPEKLVVSKVKDGETEVDIDVALSKADREELAMAFRTPKAFQAFIGETDAAKVEKTLSKKIDGFLKNKYFDSAIGKGYEVGKGIGMKNGSNVGAENLFGMQQNGGKGKETPVIDLNTSNEKIAKAREAYRNK